MTEPDAAPTVLVAGSVPPDQVTRLRASFPHLRFEAIPRAGPVPSEAYGATVLLTAGQPTDVFAQTVASLPRLEWVHTVSAGVDRHVPVLQGKRVLFTRTADARALPIAEHVVTMTLALFKRLPELLASQRRREWRRPRPLTLAGSTVGIVGAGAVGGEAAIRFKAFGARTIGLRRSSGPVPGMDEVWTSDRLHELLAASDVVVVACPLTPETRGSFDAAAFARMRPGAFLVNVARGGIVVEADLVASLSDGHLGGAALDVFEVEPLPNDSPLWRLPNVIVSPHSSSAAPDVWGAVMEEFAANLARFWRGEPLANLVDVDGRGY